MVLWRSVGAKNSSPHGDGIVFVVPCMWRGLTLSYLSITLFLCVVPFFVALSACPAVLVLPWLLPLLWLLALCGELFEVLYVLLVAEEGAQF